MSKGLENLIVCVVAAFLSAILYYAFSKATPPSEVVKLTYTDSKFVDRQRCDYFQSGEGEAIKVYVNCKN